MFTSDMSRAQAWYGRLSRVISGSGWHRDTLICLRSIIASHLGETNLALWPPQLVGDGERGGGEDEVDEHKEESHKGFPTLDWKLSFRWRALDWWKLYFYLDCRPISGSSWAENALLIKWWSWIMKPGRATLSSSSPFISQQRLALVEFRLLSSHLRFWIAFDFVIDLDCSQYSLECYPYIQVTLTDCICWRRKPSWLMWTPSSKGGHARLSMEIYKMSWIARGDSASSPSIS